MKIWVAEPRSQLDDWEYTYIAQNRCAGYLSVSAGYQEEREYAGTERELRAALSVRGAEWAIGYFCPRKDEILHWIHADGVPTSVAITWTDVVGLPAEE